MRAGNRKSTPKVVKGKVRKKNNWKSSEDYYDAPQPRVVIVDRRRPGPGYRHIVSIKDINDFIALLPDWNELAVGLNAIVLAPGEFDTAGYHVPGVVHICAWETTLWRVQTPEFYDEHKDIYERLGVECKPLAAHVAELTADALSDFEETFGRIEGDAILCKFTEEAIRAYQLLHILLHELGHHHDRMTTRSQKRASRGEPYAEQYARQYEAQIWEQYLKTFPLY